MKIEKVNINDKLKKFQDYWSPRIAGELNGQHVKLLKLKGGFIWHKHEQEDEMFLVISGELRMEFREKIVMLKAGEFIIVPNGVEHRPVAEEEVEVMLFEPATTLNTGNQTHALTRQKLERI